MIRSFFLLLALCGSLCGQQFIVTTARVGAINGPTNVTPTIWTNLFSGIQHWGTNVTSPYTQVLSAVKIDLQASGIAFTGTPRNSNYVADVNETMQQTGSNFVKSSGAAVIINCNYFRPCCSASDGGTNDNYGLVITSNVVVSTQEDNATTGLYACVVAITSANAVQIIWTNWPATNDTSWITTAVTGSNPLLYHGTTNTNFQGLGGSGAGTLQPRCTLGLTQDYRYMIWLVVDGRQPDYSDGATCASLASWMAWLGAYDAMIFDDGGSTTMAMRYQTNSAKLLNRPINGGIPGQQRADGNFLGVFANELP